MRYIIYGAGGVGGIIGAKLQLAGIDVVLIARGEHLAKVRRDGLVLKHPGETLTLPLAAVAHPREIDFRDGDAVLLTMKSQDTLEALDELRAASGGRVPVFCCQNGVENERLALRRFASVYGVLVIMPASYLEPGTVETTSWPVTGLLDIGRYPRGSDATAEAVSADLRRAGFLSNTDPDIMRVKYTKLRENMINAIHALLPPDTEADDLLDALRAETDACFAAAGIECATTAEMMGRATAMSSAIYGVGQRGWRGSSTWQSIVRGSGSTETDYINGEVVLLGRLHGVPTPANEVMTLYVDRMARDGLQPGSIDIDTLRREIAMRAQAAAGK